MAPKAVERHTDGTQWSLQLKATHLNDQGEAIEFPLEWESEGTQRLIHLLPLLHRRNSGPTVVVM
jgi:AAA15 family ATPase/GTPase